MQIILLVGSVCKGVGLGTVNIHGDVWCMENLRD